MAIPEERYIKYWHKELQQCQIGFQQVHNKPILEGLCPETGKDVKNTAPTW